MKLSNLKKIIKQSIHSLQESQRLNENIVCDASRGNSDCLFGQACSTFINGQGGIGTCVGSVGVAGGPGKTPMDTVPSKFANTPLGNTGETIGSAAKKGGNGITITLCCLWGCRDCEIKW